MKEQIKTIKKNEGSQNQALQQKSHQKDKPLGSLKMDKGITSTNRPKDKKVEQSLISERWYELYRSRKEVGRWLTGIEDFLNTWMKGFEH